MRLSSRGCESGDWRRHLLRQHRALGRKHHAYRLPRYVEPNEPHHTAKPARVERLEAGPSGRELFGRFDIQLRDITAAKLQEGPLI